VGYYLQLVARLQADGILADGARVYQPGPYGTGQSDWNSYVYQVLRPLTARFPRHSQRACISATCSDKIGQGEWCSGLDQCTEAAQMATMECTFSGAIWYWRGPAPHHFVTVPPELCQQLRAISGAVTYGWGMIPVQVQVGKTTWTTSLFPKDGGYIVPIRASAQRAEQLSVGDVVAVRLVVG